MTDSIAYVNGAYVPLSQACVSVLDRGFLFADSVYEVIPLYDGQCYRLQAHIRRLQRSLQLIRLSVERTTADWAELVEELVRRNGGGDLSVYLQVTRGVAPRREHAFPAQPEPGIVAFCQPRKPVDVNRLQQGIRAILHSDSRWQYGTIKSTALLPNVLLANAAHAAGADEALLVRDGCVLEGSSSNVFAVLDGGIVTPALRDEILPGITRGAMLELAAANNLPCTETDHLTVEQTKQAEEIWITSSTREIFPVTRIDGQAVGNGQPGTMWRTMFDLLQADTGA